MHLVAIIAENLWQSHLPDFRQLSLCEPDERVAVLVPESIALSKVPELDPDDARERWAHQASVKGSFGKTPFS